MNWLKAGAAAFGVFITVMAASPEANATTIVPSERVGFFEGRTAFDARNGGATATISPTVASGKVIDGLVQIDATDIEYWFRKRNGQTRRQAKNEAARAWTFTLTHAGQTTNLGPLPRAVNDYWFKTTAFDGLTASGDWVLTATSDYYRKAKRMIEFNLAGFFFAKVDATNPGGGSVPVPAPFLLILAGLAGIAATRRKV